MKYLLNLLLVLWASSALAQSPTLIEGHVEGYWWLFGDPSPTPACLWEADTPLTAGEFFLEDIRYEDYPCTSAWSLHCSADSLGYRGSWTTDDPTHPNWHRVDVEYHITTMISFPAPTRLYVTSESTGVLTEDSHLVTIIAAGGEETVLLGPAPGGQMEVALPAGIYTINLDVTVLERHTHYDYLADLQVWWEVDPGVGVSQRPWGAVKAVYR